MKKNVFWALIAMMALAVVSCGPKPEGPELEPVIEVGGGDYLIKEVKSLLGKSLEAADKQLVDKGYIKDDEYSEDGSYAVEYYYEDDARELEYDIYLIVNNGIVTSIESVTEANLSDYRQCSSWMDENLSYQLWCAGIGDDKIYGEGPVIDAYKQYIIDSFEAEYGEYLESGYFTQEYYDMLLKNVLNAEMPANKADYKKALAAYKQTDDIFIYETYVDYDSKYQGKMFEIEIYETMVGCYAEMGDMSDYTLNFEDEYDEPLPSSKIKRRFIKR